MTWNAVRSGKESVQFTAIPGGGWATQDRGFKLTSTANGALLYDPKRQVIETYEWRVIDQANGIYAGFLTRVTGLAGWSLAIGGTDALPQMTLTDQSGRVWTIGITNRKVASVAAPSGSVYQLRMGTGSMFDKMASIAFPGGTTKQFLYTPTPQSLALSAGSINESDLVTLGPALSADHFNPGSLDAGFYYGGASMKPLTGIIDETGVQISSYGTTDKGVTTSTQRAGGTNLYQFSISGNSTIVTEPLGSKVTIYTNPRNSERSVISYYSRKSADGLNGYNDAYVYTGDALLTQINRYSFTPNQARSTAICFNHDATRDLEVARLEGRSGNDCSSMVPLPGERLISTLWHPDWFLRIGVAMPKLLTRYIYQGQPDPTNANALANCLPAGSTVLPNGKPLAVVCKTVEQATSDETGGAGFAAVPVGNARVTTYSYDANGNVLTVNGARTDITDVITYEYYPTTDTAVPPKWYAGDLKKVTNEVGHITTYNEYDKNGNIKKVTDPTGRVSTFTYSGRDWVTGVTRTYGTASETTLIDYWANGLVKKVTQPDGSFVNFTYDAAQRLTQIVDSLGNSVVYTLDVAGNRTKEQFKDATGTLRRSIGRTMDTLSRVVSVTGGAQ